MKTILACLVMVSLLSMVGVMALEVPQGANGNVLAQIQLTPTQDPLPFGDIAVGNFGTVTNTLTAGNSNIQITLISVAPVTGTVFSTANVEFSFDAGTTFLHTNDAGFLTPVPTISALGSISPMVRLNVPAGTTSGAFTGTITYTVMEAI